MGIVTRALIWFSSLPFSRDEKKIKKIEALFPLNFVVRRLWTFQLSGSRRWKLGFSARRRFDCSKRHDVALTHVDVISVRGSINQRKAAFTRLLCKILPVKFIGVRSTQCHYGGGCKKREKNRKKDGKAGWEWGLGAGGLTSCRCKMNIKTIMHNSGC